MVDRYTFPKTPRRISDDPLQGRRDYREGYLPGEYPYSATEAAQRQATTQPLSAPTTLAQDVQPGGVAAAQAGATMGDIFSERYPQFTLYPAFEALGYVPGIGNPWFNLLTRTAPAVMRELYASRTGSVSPQGFGDWARQFVSGASTGGAGGLPSLSEFASLVNQLVSGGGTAPRELREQFTGATTEATEATERFLRGMASLTMTTLAQQALAKAIENAQMQYMGRLTQSPNTAQSFLEFLSQQGLLGDFLRSR